MTSTDMATYSSQGQTEMCAEYVERIMRSVYVRFETGAEDDREGK